MMTGMSDRLPDQTTGPDQPDQTTTPSRWARALAALPIGLALTLVAGVWAAGAVWSFEEQTAYARSLGFHLPELLPLVLDGMAVAMAAVAWAASLDARPAVLARAGTALAIAASAASNGAWAWTRTGAGDTQTVILAAGVPVVAMAAFEVLLAEVRRQVLRRRGQPGPVAITYPRLIRLVLAPWSTLRVWRALVLAATDPRAAHPTPPTPPTRGGRPEQTDAPDHTVTPDRASVQTSPLRQTPRALPAARRTTTAPVRPVRLVRSDDDAADLARLRQWQTANGGQTPSLSQIQQTVGGGRSRAVRLRGLLTQTDQEPVAV